MPTPQTASRTTLPSAPPAMAGPTLDSSINTSSSTAKIKLLTALCTSKLLDNYKYVDDVGSYTCYLLLEPVLSRMGPKQVAILEEKSPYLVEYTNPLWYRFIEKEFPKYDLPGQRAREEGTAAAGEHKKNGEKSIVSYRAVYSKLSSELEARRAKALNNLKKNYKLLELEKNSNSAIALNEDTSIRMINLTSNRKKRKLFFKDDSEFTSSAMKKVKKDVTSTRSNLFRTHQHSCSSPNVGSGFSKSSGFSAFGSSGTQPLGLVQRFSSSASRSPGTFMSGGAGASSTVTQKKPTTALRSSALFNKKSQASQPSVGSNNSEGARRNKPEHPKKRSPSIVPSPLFASATNSSSTIPVFSKPKPELVKRQPSPTEAQSSQTLPKPRQKPSIFMPRSKATNTTSTSSSSYSSTSPVMSVPSRARLQQMVPRTNSDTLLASRLSPSGMTFYDPKSFSSLNNTNKSKATPITSILPQNRVRRAGSASSLFPRAAKGPNRPIGTSKLSSFNNSDGSGSNSDAKNGTRKSKMVTSSLFSNAKRF